MRLPTKILLVPLLIAALAAAQSNNTPFQHVIIVVQENRTPDQLFGSDAFATTRQLPGADLITAGVCENPPPEPPYTIPLQSIALASACDPNHNHYPGWYKTYDNGAMDGACTIPAPGCGMTYPEYTYVQSSDVTPYFQIASQYGYANYMFQTNQGPSFPAHQFLFSGTSAPVLDDYDKYQYWEWFAAENGSTKIYGCPGTSTVVLEVEPGDTKDEYPGYQNGYPCYNHNTLANLLDPASISWNFYSEAGADDLWTAPNAIQGICMPLDSNGNCNGSEWNTHVKPFFPDQGNYKNSFAPILTDLGVPGRIQPGQCNLPGVSWVIPDGNWSDHGGAGTYGAGPSWIAAIVNAVGGVYYDDSTGKQHNTACYNPDGTPMY